MSLLITESFINRCLDHVGSTHRVKAGEIIDEEFFFTLFKEFVNTFERKIIDRQVKGESDGV